MEAPPVGRDDELADAWRQITTGGSVIFTGEVGAGKSTVVAAVVARARAAGWLVLRSAPTQAEAELPFLALIDLLAEVDSTEVGSLDQPWRAALAAMRTCDPIGGPAQQLTLRLAVLELLRRLARRGDTLLVVDDLQWVDAASAEVLGFVAGRCEGLPVRLVGAERTGEEFADDPGPTRLALCPPPVRVHDLPPLPARAMPQLLSQHIGVDWGHETVQRIHAASGGNPLYALEIARVLRRRAWPPPGEPLPVPAKLRTHMSARLAGLSQSARRTLLLASAAARPTAALLQRAGRPRAAADLAAARQLGIVAPADGAVVRFSHPLLAATLYADATSRQRQLAHARLAAAADDVIERARHRARAVAGPDTGVADELAQAARVARQRGAAAVAAELGLAAADRTPASLVAAQRRLDAARDALAGGRVDLARAAGETVLAESTSRPERVRAWLAVLDATSQALPRAETLMARALAEAGDDAGLRARVQLRTAAATWMRGRLVPALTLAQQAEALATNAGEPDTTVEAHLLRASFEFALGRPSADETLTRLLALVPDPDEPTRWQALRHLLARRHLNDDQIDDARGVLRPLLAHAEQYGRVKDMAWVLLNLAEVELRAGQCAAAGQAACRGRQLVEDAGLPTGPALAIAALVEAASGDPAQAQELARRGVDASEAAGDQIFLLRNLHALGVGALVAGDGATAVAALQRAEAIESGMGTLDPALYRWHADLAEALVRVGELDRAEQVIASARAAAEPLDRRTVLACLTRAEGLLQLARHAPRPASESLRAAAADLADLPLEYGRACYGLGIAERRQRRRAAARAAFQAALATFVEAGAAAWAARVRPEVSSADPEPEPASPMASLTPVERRIARLVTSGATNQQVATALSMSVKTVESHLSRVYRRLRIRSRAQLTATLAAGPDPAA